MKEETNPRNLSLFRWGAATTSPSDGFSWFGCVGFYRARSSLVSISEVMGSLPEECVLSAPLFRSLFSIFRLMSSRADCFSGICVSLLVVHGEGDGAGLTQRGLSENVEATRCEAAASSPRPVPPSFSTRVLAPAPASISVSALAMSSPIMGKTYTTEPI